MAHADHTSIEASLLKELRVAIRLHLAPRRHTVMLAALIVAFLVRPLIGDSGFAPTLFMVTGTNGPTPPVVTIMPGLGQSYLGIQAYGTQSNGAAQFLIANFPANTSITPNSPPTVNVYDLTTATPAVSTPIIANGGGAGMITGPDGCIYLAQGVAVWRITDTSGECNYTAQNPPPALSLTPATFSSHAAQGSPISLTATVHNATVPAGTPVRFQITGANPRSQLANTDSNGDAVLTYTGARQGTDMIVASATVKLFHHLESGAGHLGSRY